MKPEVTLERLKELLHYDPETGLFYWIKSRGGVKVGIAGTPKGIGYINIRIDTRVYQAHRLAWFYMTGEWPRGWIDHADCNPSNNSMSNLREATKSQNAANKGLLRRNTTGFKGVTKCHRGRGGYIATIKVKDKQHYLGRFDTAEDAHAAYMAAAIKFHGEFARAA